MHFNHFIFDIETVPDVDGGRRLYGFDGLDDKDVANGLFQLRRQQTGDEFLRPYLHRIVAISVVMRSNERCEVWSLGDPDSSERELIHRFFHGVGLYTPTLVSWNGSGFDLPVLHYRALINGVTAPRYWEVGDEERDFRWDNYLARFHWRHIDLMDVLAGFQPRMTAPLDEIATLLGFPGKMGMHGSKVWQAFQDGDIGGIRDYCETDVLNTYLVYLRFELMRGRLTAVEYDNECRLLRRRLQEYRRPHFDEFLQAWEMPDDGTQT
jgi:predicted PolB exonuclease-like 3'-5' exonuclease